MSFLRKFNLFNTLFTKVVNVDDANAAKTTATGIASVQQLDLTGKVPPAGDAVGNAPFTKITDGTNTVAITAANTARTTGTLVLPTQNVDATGKVSPAGDTRTNAPFVMVAGVHDHQNDHDIYIDQFRSLKTFESVRLIGAKFSGTTKDTNFWTETVTGTGSVSQANGVSVLATGATANSTAKYVTTGIARSVPFVTNIYKGVHKFSNTGSADNIRRFGAYDANNGLFFQLNETTIQIGYRAATSDTLVSLASWNILNTFVVDTNYHGYEIHLGYASIEFYIDAVLVHEINITDTLYSQELNLPITHDNINSGGSTTNVSLTTILSCIHRAGKLATAPKLKHISTATTTICKYGAGVIHSVLVGSPTNSTVTIYDNTAASGTVLSVITLGNNTTPFSFPFNNDGASFDIGLTIVTSGTADITILYE